MCPMIMINLINLPIFLILLIQIVLICLNRSANYANTEPQPPSTSNKMLTVDTVSVSNILRIFFGL
jgi:hypothetical protein